MVRWNFLMAIAVAALGISWTAVAPAQAPQTAPAIPQQQPAASYTEAELKSFAVATLDVQRIRNVYLPKLEAAATPVEQQQVRDAATSEMVQAVKKAGMTVDKYSEISAQARQSPQIAEQVQRHLQQAAGK
jgi:hypothetical protein